MYLLDTNIAPLFDPRRRDEAEAVVDWMRRHDPLLFLSTITLTEVEAGAGRPLRREEQHVLDEVVEPDGAGAERHEDLVQVRLGAEGGNRISAEDQQRARRRRRIDVVRLHIVQQLLHQRDCALPRCDLRFEVAGIDRAGQIADERADVRQPIEPPRMNKPAALVRQFHQPLIDTGDGRLHQYVRRPHSNQ